MTCIRAIRMDLHSIVIAVSGAAIPAIASGRDLAIPPRTRSPTGRGRGSRSSAANRFSIVHAKTSCFALLVFQS